MSLALQVGHAAPLAAVLHVPEPSTQSSQASHRPSQEAAFESAGEADEWEIPYEELELGPRIGIGSFGEVRPDALDHMEPWTGISGCVTLTVQIASYSCARSSWQKGIRFASEVHGVVENQCLLLCGSLLGGLNRCRAGTGSLCLP